MSSGLTRRTLRPEWRDNDTVVVDMRAFLAAHADALEVAPEPRRRKRRAVAPPPLGSALARQKAATARQNELRLRELRQQLGASEGERVRLAKECRELRARSKKLAQESLTRSRLQGTVDHLRCQLELAEAALARQRADSAEVTRSMRDALDETRHTIERLNNKVAHLERERARAIERLEDVRMDRAGQAMRITHLEMSLAERTKG